MSEHPDLKAGYDAAIATVRRFVNPERVPVLTPHGDLSCEESGFVYSSSIGACVLTYDEDGNPRSADAPVRICRANATCRALEAEANVAESGLDTITAYVTALLAEVTTLKADNKGLRALVEEHEEIKATLKARVEALEGLHAEVYSLRHDDMVKCERLRNGQPQEEACWACEFNAICDLAAALATPAQESTLTPADTSTDTCPECECNCKPSRPHTHGDDFHGTGKVSDTGGGS